MTWMSRHMLEGEGWKSKLLVEVFPMQDLPGLRRVEVEARTKGKVIHCAKEYCLGCGQHHDETGVEEEKLKKWLLSCKKELIVRFKRVMV